MIRRQMPEDHNPANCTICRFLAEPCKNCGNRHATYEEAASCMRLSNPAFSQYISAATTKR